MRFLPIVLLFLTIVSCIHCTGLFRSSSVLINRTKIQPSPRIFILRGGANKPKAEKKKKLGDVEFGSAGGGKSKKKNRKQFAKNSETEPEPESQEVSDEEFQEDDGVNGIEFKAMSLPGLHIVDVLKDYYQKTPPITKIYLLSSIAVTVLSCIFNKNQWPEILHFDWLPILGGFQFWRFFTGFIYFGALDIFFPLTVQFVWQHMSQLEKLNYDHPEEFLLMTLFGGASLILLYTVLGVSTRMLGHNLATYFVYIWARVFEGMDVNFMDLFTLKSEMLPWFFCAQTYLLDQEFPLADLLGIAVGHVYHYLKQKQLLTCPTVLQEWFATERMKNLYAQFRDNFV